MGRLHLLLLVVNNLAFLAKAARPADGLPSGALVTARL